MSYRAGVVLVLAAAVMWSTIGLAIRMIDEAGTWAVLFWRSLGMLPVLVLWVAINRGAVLRPILRTGRAGILGGLGLVLAFAGAIYAIRVTTIANAVLMFAASPFLAALLGRLLLGEPVRRTTWGAIGLALVGMAVMVGGGISGGVFWGNLAALGSAAGFALFTVMLRWGRLDDMMPAVILGAGFSATVALIVLLASGQPVMVPARDIGISVAMGACLLAFGLALYTIGSREVPAAELALLTMAEVLLAPVWVWLLLDETAGATTLAGGSLVLAAIAWNAVSGIRHRQAAPG